MMNLESLWTREAFYFETRRKSREVKGDAKKVATRLSFECNPTVAPS